MNLYFVEVRDAHQPQLENAGFTVGAVKQQGQRALELEPGSQPGQF